MNRTTAILTRLGALALLVLVVGVAPAAARHAKGQPPCWKLLVQDWYDNGRVDHTYPIPCYREAIGHLPTDVRQYSSARDDITRALQAAVAAKSASRSASSSSATTSSTTTSGTTTGGKKTAVVAPPSKRGGGPKGPKGGSHPGGKGGGPTASRPKGEVGLFPSAIRGAGPKNVDSVPIPLIVLAAIAGLLLAAGAAGYFARRLQSRRVLPRPAPVPPSDDGDSAA